MKTVKLGFSSWQNVTFGGEVDTGYTPEEWNDLDRKDQDELIQEKLNELVDIWVIND